MLNEGDIVQISELSSFNAKSWIVTLKKDAELSTHLGKVIHNEVIGHKYGDVFSLTKGQVIITYPTPRNFLRHFSLKTQILYEDDCVIACSLAGVGSGMKVGEAGTGSGALTSFLAYHVQPNGKVFSFDINPDHLDNARKNLESTMLSEYVHFSVHDIRKPIDLKDLDAFFLDFSAPFEAIDNLVPVIKGGGHLVCFVPNWSQVEKTVHKINNNPHFVLSNVFEITRRNFIVNPEKHIMRPVFRDLVYSGILIHSIRINLVKE
ncbi:MAG: tRNA (adenine-N1)-methyltransferase [Candidatus Hodarchaeota archaeon]